MAEAEHLCMKMRGVKNDSKMISITYRGIYQDSKEKENIISLIRKSNPESTSL